MTRATAFASWTLILGAALGFTACGGEEGPVPGGGAAPTKADLVGTLRELQACLDADDAAGATEFLVEFPGMSDEEMQEAVGGFVEKREISAAGIDILEAEGKFGPLREIFPERGERFAEQAGVDAGECYAISLGDAEVAAHWDGNGFRLIRLDDVGKLE